VKKTAHEVVKAKTTAPPAAREALMRLLVLFCASQCVGCYDFDALSSSFDVSGQYSVNITNGQNGCAFGNWTPGASSSGIPLAITQSGQQVVATIGGTTGDYVNFFCGSKEFVGMIVAGGFEARLACTKTFTQQTCIYRVIADAKAQVRGDVVTGTLDYTTATNSDSTCGTLVNCHSSQNFNGARPPR